MRSRLPAVAAFLLCLFGPSLTPVSAETPGTPAAGAAEQGAPMPPPRYAFDHVEGGILRLDHQTGQIAYCSAHAAGWACEAVPEDRAALEQEIARLQDRVASLQREVASLREPPPPRPPAPVPPPAAKSDEGGLKMPSHEDIDRARAALESAWRRLVDMLSGLQRDLTHKESSDGRLSL